MADIYRHPKIKHRYEDFGKTYTQAASYRVKYRDVFNIKYFYILLHEWVLENGYANRKDEMFNETFQLFRETQQNGNEYWFRWRLNKNPQIEGSKYWIYQLDITMHALAIKEKEILHQGKKYKMHSGETEVKVQAHLIYDPKKIIEKHKLLGQFKQWFFDVGKSTQYDNLKKKLYYDAYKLQEAIKAYFKLRNYTVEPPNSRFWKTKDLES